jgi:hypothetical protein
MPGALFGALFPARCSTAFNGAIGRSATGSGLTKIQTARYGFNSGSSKLLK